jgi:hypothetical protein
VLERCAVESAANATQAANLPASTILRREAWIKETKRKVAVHKLFAWRTNKEGQDSSYPAHVIHWTDYSAERATPLDREVRTAPTKSILHDIAEKLIADNLKKGWGKVA